MPSTKFISSLLLSLASLQAVSASPILEVREDYPEVIPGEGLPSLESLGLTTAQLYEMPRPEPAEMSVMFDPRCGPSDAAYTNVNSVIACYHNLKNLGTTRCGVPGSGKVTEFCRSGDAHAIGQSLTGRDESSYCSDVAIGLLWVVDHCTRPDQSVAGFAAPNGNGNFFVGGRNIRW
ncbi:Nn.00g115600.m01.CDS01 [Neocucurbitaria sp. VM-36]